VEPQSAGEKFNPEISVLPGIWVESQRQLSSCVQYFRTRARATRVTCWIVSARWRKARVSNRDTRFAVEKFSRRGNDLSIARFNRAGKPTPLFRYKTRR